MQRLPLRQLTIGLAAVAITSVPMRAQAPAAKATGTIDGIVSDTALNPLHAAFVSILGTPIRIGTGPNGRFRITKLPVGQYLLFVKRVGYRPTSGVVDVAANDTVRLSYTLEPAVVTLGTVVTTEKVQSDRMKGFEARRTLGVGHFMTQEQIEAHNAVYPTELFRGFQEINVSPNRQSVNTEYYALSAREGGNPSVGACPMQVVLDDVPLPTPFNLDLLPPPKDLAGIEIYAGASEIPQQFNGYNRGCGLILVWTRDGY
ncbi:MAG TPA: carboxypeptidase-like regulatory domain-containing protein [Gemmatimonadaceae bacterium]|nr:carboxypeptidase-like regulatory domain-containing protein [Gemmatimonadaceae bacterium]